MPLGPAAAIWRHALARAPARGGSRTTTSGCDRSCGTRFRTVETSPHRASTAVMPTRRRLRCALRTGILPPSTLSMRVRSAASVASGSVNRPEPEYRSQSVAAFAPSSTPRTSVSTWSASAIGAWRCICQKPAASTVYRNSCPSTATVSSSSREPSRSSPSTRTAWLAPSSGDAAPAAGRGSGTAMRICEPGSKPPSQTWHSSATSSSARLANGIVSIGTRTWVPRRRIEGRPWSSAIISMRVRQLRPPVSKSHAMRSIGTSSSSICPRRLICSPMVMAFHRSCPSRPTCTRSAPPTPPPMANGPASGQGGVTRSSLGSTTSTTSPVQYRSSRSCGSSSTTRTSSPGRANRTKTTRPSR